jgi:hypothetical protein
MMSNPTLRVVPHCPAFHVSARADLMISTLLFDMNDVLYHYDRSVRVTHTGGPHYGTALERF